LRNQLNGFQEQRSVAESLLSLMITRQGTRRVISEGEVLDEAGRQDGVSPDQARDALEKLVTETRLVRRDHHRGATTYEIVSEFLVPWIRPLKLQREARKARNLWLKRAAALVVVIGVILGGIFSWKYKTTTVEARGTALVKQAETAARLAQREANEAQALADRAKGDAAQLNQRLQELQSLLKTQSSDREKKLLEDLSGKEQEFIRQQARNRDLTQQIEKLGEEKAQTAQALDAEKKGRAEETAALKKQISELRSDTKQSSAPSALESVAEQKQGGAAPTAAPVSQVGILALRHDNDVKSAAFSPDGHRIVTTSSNAAYIWDAMTGGHLGKPLLHENRNDVEFAEFSSDNSRIVTVSSKEARVWDIETGTQLGDSLVHPRDVISAAFRSDGTLITVTSQRVYVWGPEFKASQGPAQQLTVTGMPLRFGERALLSATGDRILILSENSAQVREVASDKPVGAELRRHVAPHNVRFAAFSLDGRHVIIKMSDKSAQAYELESGKAGQINAKDTLYSLGLDGAGHLAVTGSFNGAQIWDAATGKPLGGSIPGIINSVALSPNAHWLVTCSGKIARVYPIMSF
jgi:WD40 repeat protein